MAKQAARSENMKTPWGAKIREIRDLRGYTREMMAEDLGITPKQFTHYENGYVKSIPTAKLIKICKILEVTPNDILLT